MEEIIITASRADIDDVVFSAAQEYADTTPLSLRERMKLTLEISDRIMLGIDSLGSAAKRSENAKKAAMARHANKAVQTNKVPTPGPAIPPPAPTVDPSQGMQATNAPLLVKPPANEQATTAPLPPPPHPALMPRGGDASQPFGAPPA